MSKVIVITGGSSGIGKSVGEYLFKKGYTVYGTSRNPQKYNSTFPLIALNVKNTDSIKTAFSEIIQKEQKIDIVINNAGIGITGPVEEIPEAEIKNHFETNFYGPIRVINAILPQMRQQNSGLIINVTSIAGYMGLPFRGVYSAGKGALNIITEAYRMELKNFNIHMCTLAPGDYATNIAAGRYHSKADNNSPYKKTYNRILKQIDEHVDEGGNPIEVAKIIHRIITTKKPKVHYKVGAFMQKFSVTLKGLLPNKIFEKLMLNHYKL